MKISIPIEGKNISGRKVRYYRIKNGLTQPMLVAKLGELGVEINVNSLSRLEHSQRIVADFELKALAICLNVNINDLLSDE